TILTTNINTEAVSCALLLYGGLSNRLLGSASFSLASQGSFSLQLTMAAVGFLQPLATGYGTMTCDRPVTALAGYLFLSASRVLLSGAAIFSSPPTMRAQLLVYPAIRLALAVANDTDTSARYQAALMDSGGQTVATATITVPARSNTAKFIDELIQVPD